jgi:hypothetical protein
LSTFIKPKHGQKLNFLQRTTKQTFVLSSNQDNASFDFKVALLFFIQEEESEVEHEIGLTQM